MTDAHTLPEISSEAASLLMSYVNEIERVAEEQKELADARSELFKNLKAHGFDSKAVRKIIAERKADPQELAEQNAILAVYRKAVEQAQGFHTPAGTPATPLGVSAASGAMRQLRDNGGWGSH